MDYINITDNTVFGNFNLYLKGIGGVDDIQRLSDYLLSHGSANKIYTDLIEYFTKSEGYFSENIKQVLKEVDDFLLEDFENTNKQKPSLINTDDVRTALAKSKDNCKNDNNKLAYINYLQGCLLQIQFKYVQAYGFFEEACSLDRNVKYYSAMGELAIKLCKYEEAEMYFDFVLYKLEEIADIHSIKYIESLNNIGGALHQQYRIKEAINYYNKAELLLIPSNDDFESNSYRGLVYNNLGGAYLALENLEESKKYFFKALEIREKHSATTNEIAITKNNLAEIFRSQKNTQKSEDLLLQAKASLNNTYKKYAEKHPTLALTLNNLGNLYLENKKFSDAKIYFEQALEIWKKVFENNYNVESIITLYNLAITCWHSRKYKEALGYFKKSLNAIESLIEIKCLKEDDPICKVIKEDYYEFINQKKYKIPFLKILYFRS
ncbi:MAG: tetratricopeptide repeat protein [Bacteriovorax sp.]